MRTTPFFVEKPWGSNYLSSQFNFKSKGPIGEAFIFSTLPNQETLVNETPLSKYLGTTIPYLIKLIDANDNLSIQVHPNDEWGKNLENSTGKTECWLIQDHEEGAGIYYGLKNGVTLEMFFKAVEQGVNNIETLLNFIPVKKNDFIVVPAGTIHAIGAGVKLIEFQQASGITYRIWDWNRPGRELHLEKAALVCNEDQRSPQIKQFGEFKKNIFNHHDFSLEKIYNNSILCLSKKTSFSVKINLDTFQVNILGNEYLSA